MAKVNYTYAQRAFRVLPDSYFTENGGPINRERYEREVARALDKIAASASHTLAGTALTDAPSGVPMSGGAEPAGAAKHHE